VHTAITILLLLLLDYHPVIPSVHDDDVLS